MAPAFYDKYGGDVCWRFEYHGDGDHSVVCQPPTGPIWGINMGCPHDTHRGEAAMAPKVYPLCQCAEYANNAFELASAAADAYKGRMCARIERSKVTICYPMKPEYNWKKGNNYMNYGCPSDMTPCIKI